MKTQFLGLTEQTASNLLHLSPLLFIFMRSQDDDACSLRFIHIHAGGQPGRRAGLLVWLVYGTLNLQAALNRTLNARYCRRAGWALGRD